MAYSKQTWHDEPTEDTPISAARLGHMEDGIEAAAEVADGIAATALLLAGGTMSGDIAMGGHKISGAADPTSAQDVATRAYVLAQIAALINSAPGILDTLGEIATALQSDESVAAALAATVALKAPLASPALTGNPTAPTPSQGDGSTHIATTQYVDTGLAARVMSLTVTGVKTADYAAASSEFVRFDTGGGQLVLTLPTQPADKTLVGAKIVTQSGTNGLTVNCGGGDLINKPGGVATFSLLLLGQAFLAEYKASDGTWTIIDDDMPLSQLDLRFLKAASNLSDLASAAAARGNLGLGNVDNTSDTGKPVSSAQQAALDLKAPLLSPTLTGTPTAPTAAQGTNTTQIATTAHVKAAIDALIAGAPGALDTLNEIAAQLASDESAVSALTTVVSGKQPLDADLTTIAAVDSTIAGALVTDGAGWIRKTYAQLKTALVLVKGDVGLGNVDNTSDANKPVSTAQATAIALKADDTAVVKLTGTQTVAGAKTFASAVAVPDDAYNATSWNSSVEVPTKNAVRDKIESLTFTPGFSAMVLAKRPITGAKYQSLLSINGSSTGSMTFGSIAALPFVFAGSCTLDRVGLEVTTAQATAKIRLGLYADDGTGQPGTLITEFTSTEIDASTTGIKEVTVSQALTGGTLYWIAAHFSVASVACRTPAGMYFPVAASNDSSEATSSAARHVWTAARAYAALPASFPTSTPTNGLGGFPNVIGRMV